MAEGRRIACSKCQQVWLVHEIPVEFIDPALYVGTCCLRPKQPDQPELLRLQLDEPGVDERRYDPAIARIPY